MTDDIYRPAVQHILQKHWPAPWYGSEQQHRQVRDLADRIVRDLMLTLMVREAEETGMYD